MVQIRALAQWAACLRVPIHQRLESLFAIFTNVFENRHTTPGGLLTVACKSLLSVAQIFAVCFTDYKLDEPDLKTETNLSTGHCICEKRENVQSRTGEVCFVPGKFVPRRGLRSGHLQTLVSHVLPRRDSLPAPERRLFRIEDEVQIACDCHWQSSRRNRFTVIIVHGLEGSSESQYVIGTANKAWAAGMNVVRMNVRGCGDTESLAATLYHSGMSADIGAVVDELIREEGLPRLGLAGFSMGGNQVLKLAGEWGSGVIGPAPEQVSGVVAVSPAMDLSLSADALHMPENRIYEWRFLLSLRARLRRKARLFPGRYEIRNWWWRSIRDFDNRVTSVLSGFRDAEDYYQKASSGRVLDRITLPTLVIHAKDDPFIRVLPETRAKLISNDNISYVETDHGGHCGFLGKCDGHDGRWAEIQIINFFLDQERRRGC